MKRSNLILIISSVLLVALLVSLYFFVIRPRLAPLEVVEPPAPPATEEPTLPSEQNSAINLYFSTPFDLRGVTRVELTLLGAEMTRKDGLTFKVFEGTERIMSQKGIVQKVFSERIFHGDAASLALSFGPTAQVVHEDGRSETVFLPSRQLVITLDEEVRLSQTLNVMTALPRSTSFGKRDAVTTLKLPPRTEAETHVMTSLFYRPRTNGEIYTLQGATLADAILADIGLDIRPREDLTGSPGFANPTEGPAQ